MNRESETAGRVAGDTVLRFRPSERQLHWAIAVPFLICFVTAAILVVVYNPAPQRPYRQLFSIVHRVSGIALIVLPPLVLIRHRLDYRVHLYNIRQGWVWTLQDVRWLCLMGLAAVSSRFHLPEQGKFNAAEKLNFMMVMTFYPLLILTGVSIWLPGVDLVAWVVHFALAALATPLMVGHIFMATVNPGTRVGLPGMIDGRVDREWAKHHYRIWYREQFEEGPARDPVPRTPEPVVNAAMLVACPACDNCYALGPAERRLDEPDPEIPTDCPHCGAGGDEVTLVMELPELHALLADLAGGSRKIPPPSP